MGRRLIVEVAKIMHGFATPRERLRDSGTDRLQIGGRYE
jgi:hypothetical protein